MLTVTEPLVTMDTNNDWAQNESSVHTGGAGEAFLPALTGRQLLASPGLQFSRSYDRAIIIPQLSAGTSLR